MMFRVHLANGEKFDVPAATADAARKAAKASHPGEIILKIKIVKGS
jgi:hypothetical protein